MNENMASITTESVNTESVNTESIHKTNRFV